MKQSTFLPIIIFSVQQNLPDDFDNFLNHEYVKQKLFDAKIDFTETVGSYKGVSELGFMVSAEHRHAAEILAKQFNQESILYSGPDRFSFLEFIQDGGQPLPIGFLEPVSESEAKSQDAWTMIDNGDKQLYYICKVR